MKLLLSLVFLLLLQSFSFVALAAPTRVSTEANKNKSHPGNYIYKNLKLLPENAPEKLPLVISSTILRDINLDYNRKPIQVELNRENVNIFAWDIFFALSYPSVNIDSGKRGTFDSRYVFGSKEPIWATYNQKRELFPILSDMTSLTGFVYDSRTPKEFDSLPSTISLSEGVGPCKGQGPVTTAEVHQYLDEAEQIGIDTMWLGGEYPQSGPNTDNLVRYQVKFNRAYYDYVRGRNLNSTKILNSIIKNGSNPVSFPAGSSSAEGAMMIKTTWAKTSQLKSPSQYYSANAMYYSQDPSLLPYGEKVCYAVDSYSLIAIHVVYKTETFPHFLFTTFANVHNQAQGFYYSNSIGGASTLPNAFGRKYKNPSNPQQGLAGGVYPVDFTINPIHPVTQAINLQAQNLIKEQYPSAVWQFYELVGTQYFPDNSEFDYINFEQDAYLANPVVESNQRFQTFTGSFTNFSTVNSRVHPYNSTSRVQATGCIGCHAAGAQGGAYSVQQIQAGPNGGTDFSFVLQAVRVNPTLYGVGTLEDPALQQILTGVSNSKFPWLN